MESKHQPSGYCYPNRFGRIFLNALEEIMGRNGINAILNMAGLPHLIGNMPPDNLNKEFYFAYFSALNQALEEMYGTRGGRGLALRSGRVLFAEGLSSFGAFIGVSDLAFRVLPLQAKLKAGLPALGGLFNQLSDQVVRVEDPGGDYFLYHIDRCPVCWARTSDRPVCFVAAGLLEESLRWVSGGRTFRVDEIKCIAVGDEACSFAIYKEPLG